MPLGKENLVISVFVAMLVILALAGVVVLYVAYPHRGHDVPNAPWMGDALKKGVEALPTLDNQRDRERQRHEAVSAGDRSGSTSAT